MSLVRVGEDHLLRKEERKYQKFNLRNNKLVKKSRPTPPLSIGDNVKYYCRKTNSFSKTATVIDFGKTAYSYLLQDDYGSKFYRHRRHCKKFNPTKANPIQCVNFNKNYNYFKPRAENNRGDVYHRTLYDIHFPPLKGCAMNNNKLALGNKPAVARATWL